MMKNFLFFGALISASFFNAQTTIFNETFEVSSPTLNSWSFQDRDGDGENWFFADASAVTDPMGFSGQTALSYSNDISSDNVLISPAIPIPAMGNISLSYLVSSLNFAPAEHYAVYVLPAATIFTGNEVPVLEETLTDAQAGIANTRTINMVPFMGQNVKLYFRHFNCEQYAIILDNVKITQNSVLGTSETNSNSQVGIYPNPTTDYLYIKSKSKVSNVEIYDAAGRKMSLNIDGNQVDVKGLKSGNYILNIETKDGLISEKFIKK